MDYKISMEQNLENRNIRIKPIIEYKKLSK